MKKMLSLEALKRYEIATGTYLHCDECEENNFIDEKVIIKFQTEENIRSLYSGVIYACPLSTYVEYEEDTGVKDINEGKNKYYIIKEFKVKNKIMRIKIRYTYNINTYKYPIYCLYVPEQHSCSDGSIELKKIDSSIIDPKYDTALLINRELFYEKIKEQCELNGLDFLFKKVLYKKSLDRKELDEFLMIPFQKDESYSSQKELRCAFYSKQIIDEDERHIIVEGIEIDKKGKILFNIGDLENCSKIVKISELKNGDYKVNFQHMSNPTTHG